MFNPQTDLDLEKLLSLAGTFFNRIESEELRTSIKAVLYGQVLGAETAYFNLLSGQEIRFLSTASGIEEGENSLDLEVGSNLFPVYLKVPVPVQTNLSGELFARFKVSAVRGGVETKPSRAVTVFYTESIDPAISWDAVGGATSYRVYREVSGDYLLVNESSDRTWSGLGTPGVAEPSGTSVIWYYKAIIPPRVYLYSTGGYNQTFETVDNNFQLYRNELRLFNPQFKTRGTRDTLSFSYQYLAVPEILSSLFFRGYGMDLQLLVDRQNYLPYLQSYNSANTETRRRLWARHLVLLSWGLLTLHRRAPSLNTLSWLWSMVAGQPFAYQDGEVTGVVDNLVTVSGDSVIVYRVPGHTLTVGTVLKQFQPLTDKAGCEDYISDLALVEEVRDNLFPGQDTGAILAFYSNEMYPSKEATDFFIGQSLPAGLLSGLLLPPPASPINFTVQWEGLDA